jgi:hypothetical protein
LKFTLIAQEELAEETIGSLTTSFKEITEWLAGKNEISTQRLIFSNKKNEKIAKISIGIKILFNDENGNKRAPL